ncbi:camphor resistance protein CrcB, partial [Peptoniphilus indolicus ATCC 29427]
MLDCLVVGLGGFIGSILRYLIGLIGVDKTQLPMKTLIINIIGSFVIGLVVAIGLKNKDLDYRWILFLRLEFVGVLQLFLHLHLKIFNC